MSILLNLLTGKLLGDGCITKQRGRKPRFQFMHSINDKEWCFHCYDEIKHFLPLSPPAYKFVPDSRTIKGFTESFYVQSRTHHMITSLESIWYYHRKKIVPLDFLELYLNDLALAWWFQDDGSLSQVDGKPRKIILSTDNFTQEENHQLISLLKRKFFLRFKLDSQNRLLLYDQLQICYFLRLIEPYIHPSMNRKNIKPLQPQ